MKKTLNNISIAIVIFFLLCINIVSGQNNHFNCSTEMPDSPEYRMSFFDGPVYSGSTDPAYLASFPIMSFNIHFWIIRKDDGTFDDLFEVNQKDVLENMEKINSLFKPMGICFVLKGIDFINETDYYTNSPWGAIPNYIPNCFNVYVPKSLTQGNGVTTFGGDKLVVVTQHLRGMGTVKKGYTLAHELAHDFGLMHLWGAANNTSITQEHVTRDPLNPNYNALTTADYIADTPAMASFYAEVPDWTQIGNVINLNDCSYIGSNHDALGVPFQLTPYDVENIMAAAPPKCASNITTGQGIRIREWIANPANANMKSLSCKRLQTKSVDLYIKDSAEDFGEEPNTLSPFTWSSPDIWVRHQADYIPAHQNPEYHPTHPNYVHIRIANRGCSTSSGNDVLKVYWSKAATSLSWDFHWAGNNFSNGASMGNLIDTITIPPIESNEEIVLSIPWNIPNPTNYQEINSEPWHFCLLSRIISNDDEMSFPETEWLGDNVANNNNIAQKNVSVIDVEPNTLGKPIGGVIAVGNIFDEIKEYSLELIPDNKDTGKKIFEEAEVSITLDDILLQAWSDGGKKGNDIKILKDGKIIVTGVNARLDNIKFKPNQIGTLNLKFNFLIKEITNKNHFTYHVIQKDFLTDKIIGGETYEIYKHTRNLFYADAGGDKSTDKNIPLTLCADDINEPAVYNWYDTDGNLVFEGLNYEVSVEAGKKYKLEVIALSDGYKDFSEIEVKLNPNAISSIFPNPTINNSTITYKINEGSSAYLSINPLDTFNGTSQNYILDTNLNEIIIDLKNYPQGLYLVSLITNGHISDTKYIVKQ